MPEANPYARFLDDRPLQEILAATPLTLESLLQAIPAEQLATPPAPGKWSPAEILCHLADCEIAFAFRLRQTLAEDHHVLQPFDQDLWAAPYKGIPAAEALATFTTLRRWNLTLARKALPAAADKPVTHPERGTMTFTTLLETMAGHDINHLRQLQTLAGFGS
jgi:uncharacterized damage-inducible protein DinB